MEQSCQTCGRPGSRKTCDRCRKRASRGGGVVSLPPSGLAEAVERELKAAGRLESAVGQQALALAVRISTPSADTGSSVAALSKELRAVMDAALADVEAESDPIDELRAWRDRKRAAAG